jgi:8-oxo-dGTP diphosphatase
VPVLYFVRHAKAGSRSHWVGDDHLRPLSKKGFKQAEKLIEVFGPHRVSGVFTSPYLRCVQTIEPLAAARRLEVQETPRLAEGSGLDSALRLASELKLDDAILCTHGDVVWELVEYLVERRIVKASQRGFDKGSTWRVVVDDAMATSATYIPAP